MLRPGSLARFIAALVLLPVFTLQQAFAWGVDGHRMINRLAAAALPAEVPLFMRTPQALAAMEYYGPEPDRWRGRGEPELSAAQAPEHFIDLEYADLVLPNPSASLPRDRYAFLRALAVAQQAHPDLPLTAEKVGLQPWVTNEIYQRLKSAMRQYRSLLAEHQDVQPVECEILFLSGWLGHYVADGSMPLHTTIHYNGWVGPDPDGYTTDHHIHSLFESVFVAANVKPADVAPLIPARPVLLNDVFDDYVAYLRHTHTLVERTYQLEKKGAFTGAGTPEGKAFVDERLAAGATELRNIIYTAWVRSGDSEPS